MTLLKVDDIAQKMGVGRPYALASIVKRPDFPRPSVYLSKKRVWWDSKDFEAWVAKCRADLNR